MRNRSARKVAVLVAVASAGLPLSHAGDVYRWVDENGKTQISDRAPSKPNGSITREDSGRYELTEGQKREAAARSAKDRARLEEAERRRAEETEALAQQAARAASAASASAAAAASAPRKPEQTECERLRAQYYASQSCYAPYRTRYGIHIEAYSACGTPIRDPSSRCGLESKP